MHVSVMLLQGVHLILLKRKGQHVHKAGHESACVYGIDGVGMCTMVVGHEQRVAKGQHMVGYEQRVARGSMCTW